MSRACYNKNRSKPFQARRNLCQPYKTYNFVGMAKNVRIFVGCFIYVLNFMILEDLGNIIDGRLSEVVLGKPFVNASKLTYDESLDFAADGNLGDLSGEEAWEAIENFTQGQKEWDNPPNIIFEQELANLNAQAKILFGNEKVYTLLVTYPEEVEETIGILMEVEPLDETQLEDLGLNTWNYDIPLSSREIPSVDEPKPQLLPISHP
ncbi:hypothetical protein Tco_0252419 [Tanacetum coccineum]